MEEDRQRCLAAGINQHLTKPVSPARLIQEIARWVAADPSPELSSGEAGGANSARSAAHYDGGALNARISEIDALLASNNIAAERHALGLRQALAGLGHEQRMHDLEQAIDRLDFPTARTILAALSSELHAAQSAVR